MIEFQSLRIQNFKKVKDFKFDFSAPRLLLIEGPNGAGKTSILDAIVYALYGETLRASRNVREAVIPSYAPELVPTVELQFRIAGKEYLVRRSLSNVEVYRDGKRHLKSQQVRSFIRNTFGDKVRFVNQCLIAPKTAQRLFLPNLSNTDRFLFFKSITELDYLEKAYEVAEADCVQLEKEKTSLENALQYGIDASYEADCRALGEKENSCKRQRSELQAELVDVNKALAEIREAKKETEKRQKEIEDLRREQKRVNEQLDSIRKAIRDKTLRLAKEESRIRESMQQEVSAVESKASNLKHELFKLEQQEAQDTSKIKEEQSRAEKEAVSRTAEKSEYLNRQLATLADKSEKYSSSFSELSAKLQKREEEIQKLRSALESKVCPECRRPYDSAEYQKKLRDKVERLELSRASIKKSLDIVSAQKSKVQQEKDRIKKMLTKQERELQSVLRRIHEETDKKLQKLAEVYKEKKNKVEKDLSTASFQVELLKKKAANVLSSDKTLLLLRDEIRQHEKAEESAARHFEEIQVKLNTLQEKYSLAAVEVQEKDALSAKAKIDERLRKLEKELQGIQQEMKTLAEKYKERRAKTEKKLKEVDRSLKVAEFWKKSFKKDLNVFLLKERLQQLEDIANKLSEDMASPLEFKFYVEAAKKVPSLELDAFHREVQSHLENFSVGETALYSFILLRALSIFLEETYSSKYNFVFYDEVLDSLDANNTEEILYQLREEAQSGKCVSIISHIKAVQDFDYFDDILSLL